MVMKWDSLDWQHRRKLEGEYDKRHEAEIPVKPEFTPPPESLRSVVEVDHRTDVYVRMNANDSGQNEAQAELRVVGSEEHLRIAFKDTKSIQKLILELKRLAEDMEEFNFDVRRHLASEKQYRDDKQRYEELREKDLRAALASGKFTEEMIKTNTDDIPF